jgi:mutator protein MutT
MLTNDVVFGLPWLAAFAAQPIEALRFDATRVEPATVGAFAIFLANSGEVLLCHRTDRDAWNLPGGRVEAGESPFAAVVREVHEEIGLHVRPVGLASIHFVQAKSDLVFTFICRFANGRAHPTSECDAIAWFESASFPASTLPRHVERILEASQHPLWPSALAPNRSIEATAQGPLRALWAAPHVER